MFRMGGTPNSNSGIVSGFEKPRENFAAGTPMTREEYLAQNTYTPEVQKGFGFNDYMALVKLGAGIAGAPNRGSGLKGFAASASPAIGQFADDLSKNKATKDALRREAEKDARLIGREFDLYEMKRSDTLEDRDVARGYAVEDRDVKIEFDTDKLTKTISANLDLADLKHDYKLAEIAAEIAGDNKTDLQFYYNEMDSITTEQAGLDMSIPEQATQYQNLQAKKSLLQQKEIVKLADEFAGNIEMSAVAGEEADKQIADIQAQREKDGKRPLTETEKSEQKLILMGRYYNTIAKATFDTRGAQAEFDRSLQADGGRIGFQNGTQPGMMPTQQSSSAITFEELRARLPREVSDSVVKLLATSEVALLDFANIATQEDIARFNQKYNSDLQLPAQGA